MFSQDYQKMIQGSWVRYKVESKSDSTQLYPNYLKFKFSNNNLDILNDPTLNFSNKPIPFVIKNKLINTGKITETGFNIEKINSDTLIISDSYENKAKRYFFIKDKSFCNFQSIEKDQSETIFTANEKCTPKQISSINTFLYSKLKGKISDDFIIKGKLIIYINEAKIEIIIESENLNNEKKLKKYIQYIKETYTFWNLYQFKNIKSVEIPFIFGGHRSKDFGKLGTLDHFGIKFL